MSGLSRRRCPTRVKSSTKQKGHRGVRSVVARAQCQVSSGRNISIVQRRCGLSLFLSLSFFFFSLFTGIHRATVLYLRPANVKLEESTEATIDIEPIDLCVQGIVCAIPISSLFITAPRYRSTKSGKEIYTFSQNHQAEKIRRFYFVLVLFTD